MAEQHSSEADRQTAKNYENKWIMARGYPVLTNKEYSQKTTEVINSK